MRECEPNNVMEEMKTWAVISGIVHMSGHNWIPLFLFELIPPSPILLPFCWLTVAVLSFLARGLWLVESILIAIL